MTMKSDQYLVHKAVALAVAAALGGYAHPHSSRRDADLHLLRRVPQ